MSDTKLTPEIRFKGYTNAWGQRKLGEVASNLVRGPFGGSLKKEIFVPKGYKVYEQQDAIYGTEAVGRYYISQEKYNEMIRFAIADGDFIISCSGTIGRVHRLPLNSPKGVINQALLKITVDESKVQPDFFLQYFRWDKFQQSITDDTQGGAIKNLVGMEIFKKTELNWPSLPEQASIGEFFRTLDTTITLHQRKLDGLRELKRGYLQLMFPQAGERVPRVRFVGFAEPWQERKLGDACDVLMCKRIFNEQTSIDGDVPFYKIGTIGKVPDAYITRQLFEEYREKFNYPLIGEVMITCAGTVGRTWQFDGEDSYYQDSNIVWLSNTAGIFVNEFLYYSIEKVDWGKLNATTITRIYNEDLRGLKIVYPTKKEQTSIGKFFRQLDKKITSQQTKADSLKQLKAAFLQQMFV